MRKILIALFLLVAAVGYGQLNNSWIDYNKTYYKFKIAQTGMYRISQSALSAAGLGNTPAQQFQLWRNGQQVSIYTSVPSGTLGGNDYIEFWGERNDGKPDKGLYRDPEWQLCDVYSVCTDTAAYFLTVNPVGNNLRYTSATNNVAGNSLPADAYFMRRVESPFKQIYNRGYAAIVGEYIYSSSYDLGEGWTSTDATPCCDLTKEITGLNVYTAGPANSVSLYIAAFGNALYTRKLRVKIFDKVVVDTPMNYFSAMKKRVDGIPLSYLQNTNFVPIYMNGDNAANPNDRIVVANVTLTYPALFNFNYEKNFYFELKASPVGNFLVIDNFNYAATPPVLYDMNEGKRYIGDINTPGKVRFALPGSTDSLRRYVLVSQEAGNIAAVNNLTIRNFINYDVAANQGDYLLISNPALYNDGNGVNNVDQYRLYRSSVTGGSYNAKIVSIEELEDQFAFGIKKHPASIRDFLRFANQQFTVKPKYVFLIGRGLSTLDYAENQSNPITDKLDLVPSFGWPPSDVLLACEPGKNVPLVPIGRLSVINGTEIGYYLNKMKQYEQAQASTSQTIADKGWMKNFIHVIGGADSLEDDLFKNYMDNYKRIAEDSLMGAKVESFRKSSTAAVQQANGDRIAALLKEGTGLIGYFGHSSANTLAFNLSSPELYDNKGKYPFFNVSGCSAGNFFIFDPTRLNGNLTLSENYVLANERGSIAFLASTHLGIPPFLNFYNTQFYLNACRNMYGNTVGNQLKQVMQTLGGAGSLDYYTRIHLEEITLHGDPALRLDNGKLPDYVIEDQLIKINPSIISVADGRFDVKVQMMNIGKVVSDSIRVIVQRKLPNDSTKILFNGMIPGIVYLDSLNFSVDINPITDKGLNKIIVILDADGAVPELSETNNTITKEFYIFEDELRPVYPYNYSIVNQQNITFSASTANPLSIPRQYRMEIDTTELFNSAFKKQYTSAGPGGLIQFVPTDINFSDSTVYYWRTSMVPLNNEPVVWNSLSFVYLQAGGPGYNQSHYYQHQKSTYSEDISLGNDRVFKFREEPRTLLIRTGLYPYTTYDRINVNLDFDQLEYYGCRYGALQFLVYDSATLTPMKNFNVFDPNTQTTNGRFGSWPLCDTYADGSRNFFEFPYDDANYRKKAIAFMDSIPDGSYVSITNIGWTGNTAFIDDWKADQASLGTGKSLYHKLKSIGFSKIDSFYKNLPFLYMYRKNRGIYTPTQIMGVTDDEQIAGSFQLAVKQSYGTIESPAYGPAKAWKSLHWRGTNIDAGPSDSTAIEVYGIKANGTRDLMATVRPASDTSLAFIDAAVYPYLKLKMLNADRTYSTPNQLRYWRVNADLVPEGAVAPNILFTMKDTVDQGEKINFALAFKNISPLAFDSLNVKFVITDRNNVPHDIAIAKKKALVSGDTLTVSYTIDTKVYPGLNTLYVMVNPDPAQPEQYAFNNFIFKEFYVKDDKYNPLLDVTFDGVHILNRDIIAAKPHILVKLKDDSRFMALADTALLKVQVRFPDHDGVQGELRTYFFGDSMQFIPATLDGQGGGDNTASINFLPYFPYDGEYELIVSGKDVVGNKAGYIEYKVSFNVINRPMISNLLNYPNPFTTSTAFVFTLTGTEIPQNMRIQILTITGKVVKEITTAELGDLHIGNNITSYKWDGTDMYGQKLANGVYLYRVLTNLNGKSLDKYDGKNDVLDIDGQRRTVVTEGVGSIDKLFNKGYGKMYLMR